MRITEDPTLVAMLNEAQLKALAQIRFLGLQLRCRTERDSAAMTAANTLPLFIKERGIEWSLKEVERILVLLIGLQPEKRALRRACKYFLTLF